jgi:hydroxysqualene dehydroxylase
MGGPGAPVFPFVDLETGERWTAHLNKSVFPWWIFSAERRVWGTKPIDYLSALKILLSKTADTTAECLNKDTALYRRFWEPMIIGVLNTEPEMASAQLLANVLRQSFCAGGGACIPLIPKIGLSETFIMPCLNVLRQHGVEVRYNHRLRSIVKSQPAGQKPEINELHFSNNDVVELENDDWVILALPAWVIRDVLPDVSTPTSFRSIINVHYRSPGVQDPPGFSGVIGGISEWVFVRHDVMSVTISCAERYDAYATRDLVVPVWRELAMMYDLDPERLPPHRIFKEKYATFAATPEQNRLRPSAYTQWKNLALAGEWTATGLPSTIEGAIRSGFKAAQVVMRWS